VSRDAEYVDWSHRLESARMLSDTMGEHKSGVHMSGLGQARRKGRRRLLY
jgi:hypothetical protein